MCTLITALIIQAESVFPLGLPALPMNKFETSDACWSPQSPISNKKKTHKLGA